MCKYPEALLCWEGGAKEMLVFPCVLYTSVDVLTGTGQKTPTGMETTCRMCSWRCWILTCRQEITDKCLDPDYQGL